MLYRAEKQRKKHGKKVILGQAKKKIETFFNTVPERFFFESSNILPLEMDEPSVIYPEGLIAEDN